MNVSGFGYWIMVPGHPLVLFESVEILELDYRFYWHSYVVLPQPEDES
jgi:hypothetical protein